MKQLIFIDNDNEQNALKEATTAERRIRLNGNVPSVLTSNIKVISDFGSLDAEDKMKLLFDNSNIICSWSMYTATHENSLGQLYSMLIKAGSNDIKNLTYIDTSGMIKDALNIFTILNLITTGRGIYNIFRAIETNNILTLDSNLCRFKRVRINIGSDNVFEYENISDTYITDLINEEIVIDKRFQPRVRK